MLSRDFDLGPVLVLIIKATPTSFNEISKISDVCSIFVKVYVLMWYKYFKPRKFCFSFVSEKGGKTPSL